MDAFAEMTPVTNDEMAHVLVFLDKGIISSRRLHLPHFGANNRTCAACNGKRTSSVRFCHFLERHEVLIIMLKRWQMREGEDPLSGERTAQLEKMTRAMEVNR